MKKSSQSSPENKSLTGLQAYLSHKPAFYGLIRAQEIYYFHKYKDHIKPPVLDLGCADGFFAKLAFTTPLDLGVDIPGIKIADGIPAIYRQTTTYDGVHLPIKSNSLQTIVSNCVFEHITDINAVISESFRCLKPGGHLITTVMTDRWEDYLLGKHIGGESYLKFLRTSQQHHNLFSEKTWQTVIKKPGFKITTSKGYLGKKTARLLEIAHFLSLPSLISYKFTNNWAPYPSWHKPLGLDSKLHNIIQKDLDTNPSNAAALFIIAQK